MRIIYLNSTIIYWLDFLSWYKSWVPLIWRIWQRGWGSWKTNFFNLHLGKNYSIILIYILINLNLVLIRDTELVLKAPSADVFKQATFLLIRKWSNFYYIEIVLKANTTFHYSSRIRTLPWSAEITFEINLFGLEYYIIHYLARLVLNWIMKDSWKVPISICWIWEWSFSNW